MKPLDITDLKLIMADQMLIIEQQRRYIEELERAKIPAEMQEPSVNGAESMVAVPD